jgi:hypothetical protein
MTEQALAGLVRAYMAPHPFGTKPSTSLEYALGSANFLVTFLATLPEAQRIDAMAVIGTKLLERADAMGGTQGTNATEGV